MDTEKFLELSKKIEVLHLEKMSKKEELKTIYENYQKVIDEIDRKAAIVMNEIRNLK